MNGTIQKTWLLVRGQSDVVWSLAFFSGWMYALFNSHALSHVIFSVSGVRISVWFVSLAFSTLAMLVAVAALRHCGHGFVERLPLAAALLMGSAGLLLAVGGVAHRDLFVLGAFCSGVGTGLATVFFGSVLTRQFVAENLIDMIVGSTAVAALVGLIATSLAVELYWISLVVLPLCMAYFCRRACKDVKVTENVLEIKGIGMSKVRYGLLLALLVAIGAMFGASRANPAGSGAPEQASYFFFACLLAAAVFMAMAYLFSVGKRNALLSFAIVLTILSTTLIVAIVLFYSPTIVFASQTITTAWFAVVLWVACANTLARRESAVRDFVLGVALAQVGQLVGAVVMDVVFSVDSGFYPAIIAAYLTTIIPVLLFTKETQGRPASPSAFADPVVACALLVEQGDLTKREGEVLEHLLKGLARAAIAHDLVISEETVKTHTRNIYKKLDVHSRFELQALARKQLDDQ
ncbi:hypothetical protein GMI70_06140 [Eggerthellaceae bacterium zg-893]|nr:hypothetical protein [Eggerthellaceae bacterium zg-893]